MQSYTSDPTWASRYGKAALDAECNEIRSAPKGARNPTLFKGAAAVYGLVAGGEVDEDLAFGELFAAGSDVGKPAKEIKRVLKSARKAGFREPRRAPNRYTDPARQTLPVPAPSRQVSALPKYASKEAIEKVFSQAIPVTKDDDVSEWLRHRGIDAALVALHDLAKSLPPDGDYPGDSVVTWVNFEGLWMAAPVAGIRLLVPFFDIFGEVRSGELVRACIEPPLPAAKSLALRGARAKLVMANHRARSLLRGEAVSAKTVVIVEGVPDFLTAGVEDHESAVFGIVQGSWKARHATVIPAEARIIIATDQDAAGEKLAATVAQTLLGRQHGRWRPHANPLLGKEKKRDVNDVGGIAGGEIEWKS